MQWSISSLQSSSAQTCSTKLILYLLWSVGCNSLLPHKKNYAHTYLQKIMLQLSIISSIDHVSSVCLYYRWFNHCSTLCLSRPALAVTAIIIKPLWLIRSCYTFFSRFSSKPNIKTSLFQAFATFILLSYVKINDKYILRYSHLRPYQITRALFSFRAGKKRSIYLIRKYLFKIS